MLSTGCFVQVGSVAADIPLGGAQTRTIGRGGANRAPPNCNRREGEGFADKKDENEREVFNYSDGGDGAGLGAELGRGGEATQRGESWGPELDIGGDANNVYRA
jgi:hypothetical protein